jgi:hypothetical protein
MLLLQRGRSVALTCTARQSVWKLLAETMALKLPLLALASVGRGVAVGGQPTASWRGSRGAILCKKNGAANVDTPRPAGLLGEQTARAAAQSVRAYSGCFDPPGTDLDWLRRALEFGQVEPDCPGLLGHPGSRLHGVQASQASTLHKAPVSLVTLLRLFNREL